MMEDNGLVKSNKSGGGSNSLKIPILSGGNEEKDTTTPTTTPNKTILPTKEKKII